MIQMCSKCIFSILPSSPFPLCPVSKGSHTLLHRWPLYDHCMLCPSQPTSQPARVHRRIKSYFIECFQVSLQRREERQQMVVHVHPAFFISRLPLQGRTSVYLQKQLCVREDRKVHLWGDVLFSLRNEYVTNYVMTQKTADLGGLGPEPPYSSGQRDSPPHSHPHHLGSQVRHLS